MRLLKDLWKIVKNYAVFYVKKLWPGSGTIIPDPDLTWPKMSWILPDLDPIHNTELKHIQSAIIAYKISDLT
jgi:hypothetical protein